MVGSLVGVSGYRLTLNSLRPSEYKSEFTLETTSTFSTAAIHRAQGPHQHFPFPCIILPSPPIVSHSVTCNVKHFFSSSRLPKTQLFIMTTSTTIFMANDPHGVPHTSTHKPRYLCPSLPLTRTPFLIYWFIPAVAEHSVAMIHTKELGSESIELRILGPFLLSSKSRQSVQFCIFLLSPTFSHPHISGLLSCHNDTQSDSPG